MLSSPNQSLLTFFLDTIEMFSHQNDQKMAGKMDEANLRPKKVNHLALARVQKIHCALSAKSLSFSPFSRGRKRFSS